MKGYQDFSLLIDKLPTTLCCGGIIYKLDTRTSTALQALYLLAMDEVPATNRILSIQSILVRNVDEITPKTMGEVDEELFDYLAGYPSTNMSHERGKEVFSYVQDHDLIVSSFREAYGFTLDEIQDMHYWLFLAYLRGLPSDTRLGNVIQIRLTDITSKDSPEARRAKIKAKQAVALKPRKLYGDSEDGYDIISMGLEQGDK